MPCSMVDCLPFQIYLILVFTVIKTWCVTKDRISFVVNSSRMYRGHHIILL